MHSYLKLQTLLCRVLLQSNDYLSNDKFQASERMDTFLINSPRYNEWIQARSDP